MSKGPGGLRVVLQRQVAVGPEDELVVLEAVLPQEMLGLIEPELALRRGRALCLQRCPHDRLEGAEVSVMQKALSLEPSHEPEDFTIGLARGADDELGRRSDHEGLGWRIEAPALEGEATSQLELRQQVSAEVLLAG